MANTIPTPRVSVVIRSQGRRLKLLEEAVMSVLNQDYPNIEILLVEDGGSSLAEWINTIRPPEEARLAYLPLRRVGRCEAGNAGLAAGKGEYLMFLDEDDYLEPHHVRTLISGLLSSPSHKVGYTKARREVCSGLARDEAKSPRALPPTGPHPYSKARLWFVNELAIQSVLFHRSLFEEYGGLDPNLDALEDWDLWLRFSAVTDFLSINEVTSTYRMPREKDRIRDRAHLHDLSERKLREKLAKFESPMRFCDISNIAEPAQARIGIRRALGIAKADLIRRLNAL